MIHNQHIYNIGYRGGSGGFLFLHFLLLSDLYHTDIFDNVNFSDVIAQQWNISNHTLWKNTEFWPNSIKTIESNTESSKILFFCNPGLEDFFQKKQQLDFIIKCYRDIMDPTWPALHSIENFINLPDWICQELDHTLESRNMLQYLRQQRLDKTVWLYTDFDSQNELAYYKKAYLYYNRPQQKKIQNVADLTEMWNGISVDKNAVYFLNHSDIQIKLQDLVNSPELLIDHGLIEKVNQKQYDLLKHWKSLHPPELLNKIGIK